MTITVQRSGVYDHIGDRYYSGDEGSFAFPSEILVNTLREMPEQPIELIHEEDTHGLTMNSSYGTYRSSSNDVEDYPKIPELEYETKVTYREVVLKAFNYLCLCGSHRDEMKITICWGYPLPSSPMPLKWLQQMLTKWSNTPCFTTMKESKPTSSYPRK